MYKVCKFILIKFILISKTKLYNKFLKNNWWIIWQYSSQIKRLNIILYMVLLSLIKIHNSESYGQNEIYVPIEII